MATVKLYYWNIKARGQVPALLLNVAGIKHELVKDFEWPGSLKEKTPFGQVPFLEDGDIKVAQSMAIARYIARKGNLLGDNDHDFSISEQLIEEQNDIYNALAKAQYAPDEKKSDEWKNSLEKTIPAHLANLEKLIKGDYFASKLTAGDIAIWSIFNIVLDVDPHALDKFPKLHAFYEKVKAHPGVAAYINSGVAVYFKRS